MTRRLVLVRHGDDPPDDRVVTYAAARGIPYEIVKPFKGDSLGEPDDDVLGTVIYGGPQNVFEEDIHPHLHEEARWIRGCMAKGIPTLGICQGAQQIARVMGAKVGAKPGEPYEFGYYPIRPTEAGRSVLPESLVVCQAHFHTFDIPEGAEHLAGSETFPNQAFRIGPKVYGFQFHPEVTIEGFRRWQEAKWAQYGKPGVQSREEQDELMLRHDKAQADWFYGFLSELFGDAP